MIISKEKDIEELFISKLKSLKYQYNQDIIDRETLENNFRAKFEELNAVKLTNKEFDRLLDEIITPDVFQASRILRETNTFKREDDTPLHYTLVNTKDWCKNTFEIINQMRINTDNSHQRYDVIILINGIPAVQIELKRHDINPRTAMQQIVEYKEERGNGYKNTLMCFMQIFIASNVSKTFYFTNNDSKYLQFDAREQFLPIYQFASHDNDKIDNLYQFAEEFLGKCKLGEMISRYMVLIETEKKLMIMRPYQIYAVKNIMECIKQKTGNGYIWHTTGSGKTLTSFKASTLLKSNPDIDKCLFVVDRKDLDNQTRKEFNRFQENCVEQNINTESLVQKLLSEDYKDKVIVTTIQKLGLALTHNRQNFKERLQPIQNKRIIFIFDECHRSQFGKNHDAIKQFFPEAQLFGFTGTPITDINSPRTQIAGEQASFKTTKDIFQQELHAYTIADAIDDKNVLPFNIDYYQPEGDDIPKQGKPLAKKAIVKAILQKHLAGTSQRKFNALFATSSINDAIEYYQLFKETQAEYPDYQPLNIACVFSPPPNISEEATQMQEDLPQEKQDYQTQPNEKKQALEAIIADYNSKYQENCNINEFDKYYQDIQQRIRDQEYSKEDLSPDKKIDITIVVDMLLTGFDSKYLNTLYVDKSLKYHGLVQAFSRTNRTLNTNKPHGNIIDFRAQQKDIQEAIELFSGKHADRASQIWLVEKAPIVIEKLQEKTQKFEAFMKSHNLECTPSDVVNLKGDEARMRFIDLFKEIRRTKTQLEQYTDLTPTQQDNIEKLLPEETLRGFQGVYLSTAETFRKTMQHAPKDSPLQTQLDFQYVLFASDFIDYDYIMKLVADYINTPPEQRKMTREQLVNMFYADSKFIGDREMLEAYIDSLSSGEAMNEAEIKAGFNIFKMGKQEKLIAEIAEKYQLNLQSLHEFIAHIVSRKVFDDDALRALFDPLGLNWKQRATKELEMIDELGVILHERADGQKISGLDAYEKQ